MASCVAFCAALWDAFGDPSPQLSPVADESVTWSEEEGAEAHLAKPPGVDDAPEAGQGGASEGATAATSKASPGQLAPVYSEELLWLRARAQARILGAARIIEDRYGRVGPPPRGKHERPVNNGNALGEYVPIENESALTHFHQALDDLKNNPHGQKVRVAAYGASHTQADIYSGYLRYYLQSRFGNGGVGFIPVGLQKSWARRLGYEVKNSAMQVRYAQQRKRPRRGPLGLAGSVGISRPGGYTRVEPSDEDVDLQSSQFDLFYASQPRGGDLEVRVDGESLALLSGRSKSITARYYHFERPLGFHDVKLRTTSGPVRLFGLAAERDEAGIVVDTLGIRGTRAANMLLWDQQLWTEHLRMRSPDLVMFAYGTNETTDRGEAMPRYRRRLAEVLRRMRNALPESSCVLIGPGDFPKGRGANWVPRPRLLKIIEAQRSIAERFDCGFWDTYAFMGGAGSMHEWTRARPQMGAGDHIHLTKRGYVLMGMSLGDALMRAYDDRNVPAHKRVVSERQLSSASTVDPSTPSESRKL